MLTERPAFCKFILSKSQEIAAVTVLSSMNNDSNGLERINLVNEANNTVINVTTANFTFTSVNSTTLTILYVVLPGGSFNGYNITYELRPNITNNTNNNTNSSYEETPGLNYTENTTPNNSNSSNNTNNNTNTTTSNTTNNASNNSSNKPNNTSNSTNDSTNNGGNNSPTNTTVRDDCFQRVSCLSCLQNSQCAWAFRNEYCFNSLSAGVGQSDYIIRDKTSDECSPKVANIEREVKNGSVELSFVVDLTQDVKALIYTQYFQGDNSGEVSLSINVANPKYEGLIYTFGRSYSNNPVAKIDIKIKDIYDNFSMSGDFFKVFYVHSPLKTSSNSTTKTPTGRLLVNGQDDRVLQEDINISQATTTQTRTLSVEYVGALSLIHI
eukprot:TRINITY_DN11221_c0_g1_i1.p1 TRINITY_DN11221_c0_g1~~TRINITY_DN11221_c0_g1_i1.p1  ORF type:complete len:382 (-),score=43.40 TRINITY_DN11221_c0_g1_i1:57-1202(-)